jgi:hypothetical protein
MLLFFLNRFFISFRVSKRLFFISFRVSMLLSFLNRFFISFLVSRWLSFLYRFFIFPCLHFSLPFLLLVFIPPPSGDDFTVQQPDWVPYVPRETKTSHTVPYMITHSLAPDILL